MRKIALFLLLLPAVTFAQKVETKTNKFDGSVSTTYSAKGFKVLSVPVFLFKNIKNGDTSFAMLFSQSVSREDYIRRHDGKVGVFEVLQEDGKLVAFPPELLDSLRVQYSPDGGYGYSAYTELKITPAIFKYFKNAKGVRVNEIGEGILFGDNKKNKEEYQKIIAAFTSDNPDFQ